MPLLQWQLYPLEIIHSSDRCTAHTFIDFSYLPSPSLPLSLSSPSSSKCPHHYLSEESLHLIRSSDRRPPPRLDFIIGRHCTALHTCFLPSHSASTTSTALSSATVHHYSHCCLLLLCDLAVTMYQLDPHSSLPYSPYPPHTGRVVFLEQLVAVQNNP